MAGTCVSKTSTRAHVVNNEVIITRRMCQKIHGCSAPGRNTARAIDLDPDSQYARLLHVLVIITGSNLLLSTISRCIPAASKTLCHEENDETSSEINANIANVGTP